MPEYLAPPGRQVVKWEPLSGPAAKKGIEALCTRLAAEHEAERARWMCDFNPQHAHPPEPGRQRHHGVTVRTFMPASATAITVTALGGSRARRTAPGCYSVGWTVDELSVGEAFRLDARDVRL
jgi:hypothetical protein